MKKGIQLFIFLCAVIASKDSFAQECPEKIFFYVNNLDKNELPVRFLPQLKQLCAANGLIMEEYIVRHEMGKGEEQLRREAIMNGCIEKKFGKGFREKLIKRADSIFIAKSANSIIEFDYCDYWPHPKDEPEDRYRKGIVDPDRNIKIGERLYRQLPSDENDNKPTLTISFLVSKEGTISNIKPVYMPFDVAIKNKELLLKPQAIIKKQIMAESPWVPGQVAGHNVTTKYILTVNFYTP